MPKPPYNLQFDEHQRLKQTLLSLKLQRFVYAIAFQTSKEVKTSLVPRTIGGNHECLENISSLLRKKDNMHTCLAHCYSSESGTHT